MLHYLTGWTDEKPKIDGFIFLLKEILIYKRFLVKYFINKKFDVYVNYELILPFCVKNVSNKCNVIISFF